MDAEDAPVCGISTDSRTIKRGELFVPLEGKSFDGHEFIRQARENGAVAVLSAATLGDSGTLYVEDTLTALGEIAACYRRKFTAKITAVTGSAGKTTTKEMIAAVLSEQYETLKSAGNLNNAIGVPLSVLKLEKKHGAAVFEMGMNHFGEISYVAKIAQPDITVVSNIGTAHIEFLGSREGIRDAKLEILDGLVDGGVFVYNGDEPLLRREYNCRTVKFGFSADCDVRAENIRGSENGTAFDVFFGGEKKGMFIPAAGDHNVLNALAAVAVGMEYGISIELIARGIAGFENAGMRQNIFVRDGFKIIDDCYNANPESMAAALNVLAKTETKGRKIAVLGDMRELGRNSPEEHYKLGLLAAESADAVFLYGRETIDTLRGAGGIARRFATHEALAAALTTFAEPGDTILFKGSRGMRMENAMNFFLEKKFE